MASPLPSPAPSPSAPGPEGFLPRPLMRTVVRLAVRPVLGPDVPAPRQRRLLDLVSGVARLPRGTGVTRTVLGGRPAERITPPGAGGGTGSGGTGSGPDSPALTVLHLHGGGYTAGSFTTHRALAAHLAAAAGAVVHVLDYRLAPEHPHPAALDDATAAYRELLDAGIPPGRLAVTGDSAGGGLALALACRLRDAALPLPAALALVSPWVDLSLADPRTHDDRRDPMLRASWLRACAECHAAGRPLTDPALSPLYGDLSGLPPVLIHAGSDEILRHDADRLTARLRADGTPVEHRLLDGLWHVAHLHAGLMRASTAAVRDLAVFLRRATGPTGT